MNGPTGRARAVAPSPGRRRTGGRGARSRRGAGQSPLRDGVPTVLDAGAGEAPAARSAVEVADRALMVIRPATGAAPGRRRSPSRPVVRGDPGGAPGRVLTPARPPPSSASPFVGRFPLRAEIARLFDAESCGTGPSRRVGHPGQPPSLEGRPMRPAGGRRDGRWSPPAGLTGCWPTEITEILLTAVGRPSSNDRVAPSGGGGSTRHGVRRVVERIIAPLGLRLDRSSPMVDARSLMVPVFTPSSRRGGRRHLLASAVSAPAAPAGGLLPGDTPNPPARWRRRAPSCSGRAVAAGWNLLCPWTGAGRRRLLNAWPARWRPKSGSSPSRRPRLALGQPTSCGWRPVRPTPRGPAQSRFGLCPGGTAAPARPPDRRRGPGGGGLRSPPGANTGIADRSAHPRTARPKPPSPDWRASPSWPGPAFRSARSGPNPRFG